MFKTYKGHMIYSSLVKSLRYVQSDNAFSSISSGELWQTDVSPLKGNK